MPGDGNNLDREPNDGNLMMSDPSGVRGRSMSRLSASFGKERHRSHSADDIGLTVNDPRLDLIGYEDTESPSPGVCNDLKNVLFLAERDGDNWNSASDTEDDDSSDMSGSDSDVMSDSCNHEDAHDETCTTPNVIITDRLRQLASSTYTVPNDMQPSPMVKVVDHPIINAVQDEGEQSPEDPVRVFDSENVEVTKADHPEVLSLGTAVGEESVAELKPFANQCGPPVIVLVQDGEEHLPKDHAEVLNLDTPVGEESVAELKPFANQCGPAVVVLVQGVEEHLPEDHAEVLNPGIAVGEESAPELKPSADHSGPPVVVLVQDAEEHLPEGHAEVLNLDTPIDEESVPELKPFTNQSEPAVVILVPDEKEHLPEDQCIEDSVEVLGSGSAETTDSDNAVDSNLADSVREELVVELGKPSADQSESTNETSTCDAVKPLVNLPQPENEDVDGTDGSSYKVVVMMSELQKTCTGSSETLPTIYLERQTLECERLFSGNDGSDTVPTNSDEIFPRDDSVISDVRSKSQSSSVSCGSSMEYLHASTQDVRSVAAGDEFFYTSAELDAVTVETGDPEVTLEHRGSIGSMEDVLGHGREPNYVFRLARAYSTRVKEMKASASAPPRGCVSRLRQNSTDSNLKKDSASPSNGSRFLPARKSEVSSVLLHAAAESEDSAMHDVVGRRDSGRSRAKSVDETVTFPQTTVRETIRKLKQKASSSSVTQPRQQSGVFTPMSESFHRPNLTTEDSPQQSVGTSSSQRPLAARQTSSLVQERVRMLRGSGGFE